MGTRTVLAGMAGLLLSACASTPPSDLSDAAAQWQGRLAMTLDSVPASALSADFELQGSPQAGELRLYSPLGTTLAALQWRSGQAQLDQGTQVLRYDSISELTEKTTGAAIPLEALFDWLAGRSPRAPGWVFEVASRHKLLAYRESPAPRVTLRVQTEVRR